MKKIILVFFVISFLSQKSFSQVIVDDVNINELGIDVIELLAVPKSYVEYSIYVDYGVKWKLFKRQKISNKDGVLQEFNTPIASLNFFLSNGWELVQYSRVSSSVSYILKLKE